VYGEEYLECYGYIHALSDGGSSAFNAFINASESWPSGASVFNTQQTGGYTYIVDEQGNVLGSVYTSSVLGTGLPGMTALSGSVGTLYSGPVTMTLNGVTYQVDGFTSVSPIIIDVDGTGKPDVDKGDWKPHADRFNIRKARMFDIDGCGDPELTEWLGPHSGLLCVPSEEAKVVGGKQLFGTAVGYVDGYQKLALLRDKNHDGVISGDELKGMMVWIDKNGDGICTPDELHSVQELGITAIDCRDKDFQASCVMNGQKRLTWDWWPSCYKVHKVASH